MKIKTRNLPYEEVLKLPREPRRKPARPGWFFRTLLKILSAGELKDVGFQLTREDMDKLGPAEPALFLMNHSCFLDLKIASTILYPRPFNIVCTSDGFVGKRWLMEKLGCIPTQKFVSDPALVRDMVYALKRLNSSVLLYPEASYTFDGTATPLPDTLGKCLKLLKVPVVMISTQGAFLHDPLYNGLKLRKVPVRATMRYLLSPADIEQRTVAELNEILKEQFTFDGFRYQREAGIRVTEPFRADGLNRVLYKCPACGAEGHMEGKGTQLTCRACGKVWTLNELGALEAEDGHPLFDHVPDWYAWERDEVKKEIENGSYRLDLPVQIRMLVDTKCLYTVGDGRLVHDGTGFTLTGCDGKLAYTQSPLASYSLYADYFWYELGDMICIGDSKTLYYCFPLTGGDVVAKTRLAAEELYKLRMKRG